MRNLKLFFGFFALMGAILTSNGQSVLTNGLIAYYPLDGTLNDFSGNGLNGSFFDYSGPGQGPYGLDQFGNTNGACYFDGTAGPAVVLPAQTINNLSAGTISTWVRLTNNTQEGIFAKQHDGANSYAVLSVGSYSSSSGPATGGVPGTLYFHAQNGLPDAVSSTTLQTGVWYQIVVTFNKTSCSFYVNGAPAGSTAGNFSIPNDLSGITCTIGSWLSPNGSQNLSFQGAIDRFRIYGIALSSTNVAQLYADEVLGGFPQITRNLTNFNAVFGQNTTLSVGATSALPLSYQWYFQGSNSPGLATAYAETISGFVYGVVVANGGYGYGNVPGVGFVGGGGTGAAGYATVTNDMVSAIVVTNAGSGYTSAPSVVIGPPNGLLVGQTNNTLSLTNINIADFGQYYVVLTNSVGSVTSSVVSLNEVYPPTITNNPVGFDLGIHGSNTLSVAVSGTPPFGYQWMLNGTNLAGATNGFYIISNLVATNTGNYSVEVFNAYGYTTSTAAMVEISPSITTPFVGAVGLWGQSVDLSVVAVGSGTLSYQWYFNGAPIPGATSSSYGFGSIQTTNAGLYSVVVSSIYGSVTNQPYQVVVNPANVSLGVYPGVTISGTVGYVYTIQSSTNLGNINGWTTLTNLTLTAPTEIWSDYGTDTGSPNNPLKYYRVEPGQ